VRSGISGRSGSVTSTGANNSTVTIDGGEIEGDVNSSINSLTFSDSNSTSFEQFTEEFVTVTNDFTGATSRTFDRVGGSLTAPLLAVQSLRQV
jgi:hypothetical protein